VTVYLNYHISFKIQDVNGETILKEITYSNEKMENDVYKNVVIRIGIAVRILNQGHCDRFKYHSVSSHEIKSHM
jgi:hypothetical protein